MKDPTFRVAARFLEAKKQTFVEAKTDILAHLKKEGWAVKDGLAVPHATSPDGEVRVWFKPQAVLMSKGNNHSLGAARSMWTDIRSMSGPTFLKEVEKWSKG